MIAQTANVVPASDRPWNEIPIDSEVIPRNGVMATVGLEFRRMIDHTDAETCVPQLGTRPLSVTVYPPPTPYLTVIVTWVLVLSAPSLAIAVSTYVPGWVKCAAVTA